jgi:hypothetical protein
MKNSTSKEAFYQRLKQLAEVDRTSVKELKTRNLGTLIDYKRAADGVSYGIIKEQHHYFVKKGGLKKDPDASDFAYIGGLANITNFQYKSLAEAEKQRNMMLHTINEAVSLKADKNGSKKSKINEDKAAEEIKASEEMAAGLDAAADAEQAPAEPAPMGGDEMPAEMPAPEGGEEAPAEMPEPEGGEEMPAPEGGEEGGEDVPAEMPEPEGGEGEEVPAPEGGEGEETPEGGEEAPEGGEELAPEDEKSLTIKEIEKNLGKLTQKIRGTELEPSLVKGYIQSYLKAFKDKMDGLEIDERKDLADLILKVVPDEDIEDLGSSVPQDDEESGVVPTATPEEEPVAEEMCAECGSFGKYAESRGYTKESLMECGEEEMTNLVSGYANAHNDGQNDGDFKVVALLVTPEMVEKLKGDYGHDDYAEKLTPYVNSVNPEEKEQQLAEAWKDIWGGVKQAGREIGAAAKQAATGVKQAYHGMGVNPAFNKLGAIAADLGKQINAANEKAKKAGQTPVPVQAIMDKISQQITSPEAIGKSGQQLTGAAADAWRLGKTAKSTAGNVNLSGDQLRYAAEGVVDPGNVEVQPNMLREDDEPEMDDKEHDEHEKGETPEEERAEHLPGGEEFNGFAPDAANLGAAINKPIGAGVEIEVTPDKTVRIEMSEGEKKLRKYIRERLEVRTGVRKQSLNESKKSPKLKKLDTVIDQQLKLYESVVLKKRVNEGLGDVVGKGVNAFNQSIEGKFKKQRELKAAIQSNPESVKNALTKAYSAEIMFNAGLGKYISAATPENAMDIAQQAANDPDGLGKVTVQNGVLVYIPAIKM